MKEYLYEGDIKKFAKDYKSGRLETVQTYQFVIQHESPSLIDSVFGVDRTRERLDREHDKNLRNNNRARLFYRGLERRFQDPYH